MLEFKYDFLEKVILPLTNRAIEVDIISVYLALTESIIKECMTGEACDINTNWVQKNCIDRDYIPDDVLNFLPRVCCEKHKKFDTRTNSFFIEWFCLNRKTYRAYNEYNDTLNMAMKGSNRSTCEPLQKKQECTTNEKT